MVQQTRRLYKSRDDRFLFGVAGGVAEYSDIDPVLVRVAWVLLTIATGGIGLLVYIVMAIITPSGGSVVSTSTHDDETAVDTPDRVDDSPTHVRTSRRLVARNTLAIGLIVVGAIILVNNLGVFGSIRWDIIWPVAIVALGLTILIPSIRR